MKDEDSHLKPQIDERNKNYITKCATWICGALIFFCVYFLSIGPFVRWGESMPKFMMKAIEIVYSPLEWVYESSPLVKKPMRKYIDLWEK